MQALRRCGLPDEVLTDNGRQFTARFGRGGEVLFDRICRDDAITHRLAEPASPTTTAKIERFHGSLRREFLDHAGLFQSLMAAQAAVDTWVTSYNCDRPHQAPGHGPVTCEGARPPGPPPRPSVEPVTVQRRASATGVITVTGQQICLGRLRACSVVTVHVRLARGLPASGAGVAAFQFVHHLTDREAGRGLRRRELDEGLDHFRDIGLRRDERPGVFE